MATLVAPDGTTFELAEGETLVGRGEREVGDPPKVNLGGLMGGLTVSRQHARLRQDNEQWYVEAERQSTNSTTVDGLSLPRGLAMPIQDGSRLQLGEVLMTFRGPSAPTGVDGDTLDGEERDGATPPTRLVSAAPPGVREVASWVGRLPTRPAVVDAFGNGLTRVNPFEGLMVDAITWSDEQNYHRDAARLHLLAGHGFGIVDGLEVTVDARSPKTLIVRAGVAIDPVGRLLVVPREMQVEAHFGTGQQCFVVLSYAEQLTQPQNAWDGAEHATRVMESSQITVEPHSPVPPALELARFVLSDTLGDAIDPTNPRPSEVDLRFRERQLIHPRPDLSIAQLSGWTGEDQANLRHRLGLRFLTREIGQTTTYRPRWAGVVGPDQALPPVAMLYVTGDGGFELDDAALDRLRLFLNGGGVLFADPCHDGRWEEFIASMDQVATQLELQPGAVERWHPVLLSRHVLVAPTDPPLYEVAGIVISHADYGCAWLGGPEHAPLRRDGIREALELGTNVAVYGQQRRRPLDVLDFDA